MFKNQIKFLFRTLKRNKWLSFMNIMGLAVGMAVTTLIGLWVHNQLSYDQFHTNRDRLFRVVSHEKALDGSINTMYALPIPLATHLATQIPEIEAVALQDWAFSHGLQVGNNKLLRRGYFTSKTYLQAFEFPFISGDAETALEDIHSIVLTEALAASLFGDQNPMGETVKLDNEIDLKVTGVLADIPNNSSIQFDYLVPIALNIQKIPWMATAENDWTYRAFQIFVELKPGVAPEAVTAKIKDILTEHNNDARGPLDLFALKDFHLKNEFVDGKLSGGFIIYVRLFAIIGLFILLIAIINFINLSTAHSEKRAREVGVRKTLGASQGQLIAQYLGESFLVTLLSFSLAMILVDFALPYFNQLVNENIILPYANYQFWLLAIWMLIGTALLAGLYPAFFLSRFKPIDTLKNQVLNTSGSQGGRPRQVLVTSQFTISITLIICTLIVWQQITHLSNRPKGFAADHLMIIENSQDLINNQAAVNQALQQSQSVQDFTRASSPITGVFSYADLQWPGKDPNERVNWPRIATSWDYTKTLGIKFKEGRDFNIEMPSDSNAVIINEAAALQMNMEQPLGQKLNIYGAEKTIIGVIEDVIMLTPHQPVMPTVIECNPFWAGYLMIRLNPEVPISTAISELKTIFDQYNPALPFSYTFADEAYAEKFQHIEMIGQAVGIFGMIAILISCLGLFGLAAYMAERRSKELGIRKVLGATVMELWTLLNKGFFRLILVAGLIAIPIAFYTMNNWLDNYDYRINISIWVFIIGGGIAFFVSLITMSIQTVRAALINPVEALRDE